MSQVVSMVEAKSRLAELVGQVKFGGKQYILERRGRPMAMLISVEEYEQLRAQGAAAGLVRRHYPRSCSAAKRRWWRGLGSCARSMEHQRIGLPNCLLICRPTTMIFGSRFRKHADGVARSGRSDNAIAQPTGS